jgi:hypothetical protein
MLRIRSGVIGCVSAKCRTLLNRLVLVSPENISYFPIKPAGAYAIYAAVLSIAAAIVVATFGKQLTRRGD